MNKEQVGMIQFSTQVNGEEALFIQLYRDGTIIRDGGGGLPPIFVKAQLNGADNLTFRQLLEIIPEPVLERPIVWQSPEPASLPIDYRVLCYGRNLNQGIGADAEWGDMSGIRVQFDLEKPPPHAFVALADKLVNAAKIMTNRIYLDMLVRAATGFHSAQLNGRMHIDALETTPEWLENALARFILQLVQLNPGFKVEDLTKGRFYRGTDGKQYLLWRSVQGGRLNYRFIPA